MAIITQRGTVDLIPEYNRALRPIFCVSEGDANSRVINLSVTSGGEAFTIPSGAMVYVAGKKQDNNIFTYGCSFTSNTVVFPITAQMSALDGIVLCELQIIQNGNPLGTANFVYWVEPSPIQNGTTSESDLNLFEEAIAKFENFDHFYADVEAMVTEAVANMQIREGQTVIDASLTVEGAAADAKATGDIVRAFMDALVTESTAEAAIATCDDAAGGLPLKKLTANIAPAQAGSGDPSPDNVRPISGYTGVTVTRAGKNLVTIPNVSSAGITITPNSDGTYKFSGTATGSNFNYNIYTGAPIRGRLKIKISGISISDLGLGGFYASDADGANIFYRQGEGIFNADNGISRLWLYLSSGATVSGNNVEVMLYSADLDDTYSPYETWATYPVTFPTAAGTVYGGTLIVNSDGSGALTVDKGYHAVTDADSTTLFQTGPNANRIGVVVNGSALSPTVADRLNIMSNIAKADISILTQPQQAVGTCCLYSAGADTASRALFGVPTTEDTAEKAKAWLITQGCTFVYPLATPTTYALSAVQVATMLNGVNNIWTDAAGTLTAEYYASTGLYVEKRVNAQRNMIAGVEEAMIATKNYSVNDLLIVGNTLYKVTAAISSGAALVVGTNVTETTVAEQLLALA